jgi:hypothetical protein
MKKKVAQEIEKNRRRGERGRKRKRENEKTHTIPINGIDTNTHSGGDMKRKICKTSPEPQARVEIAASVRTQNSFGDKGHRQARVNENQTMDDSM